MSRRNGETSPEERLATAIRTLMRALTVGSQTAAATDGRAAFSTTELAVLGTIRERPGITAREIAAARGLTPTTVQSILERFARRDLVARSRHQSDGRAVALNLSEHGQETLGAIYATDIANCAAMLDVLPARRRAAFVDDLAQIADRLSGSSGDEA